MAKLSIHGVTLSVDFADKSYGSGNGRFMSVSSKVPDGTEGIPLTDAGADEVMSNGIDMYLTAWQTLLQTRFATGEITGEEYKEQTAAFLVRIDRVKRLYQKIKGKTVQELEGFLKKAEEK